MRSHEEFTNEVYKRKEKYIRERNKTRKGLISFSIPFIIAAVAYSVLILPAMMPAGSEDTNYDSHTTNDETTTVMNETYSYQTQVCTEAASSVKQPSANSSPTTVAHSVSATEISSTRAPEAIKPPTSSPEIFIELDRTEYKADDKITLSITDTANVGFGYSKFVKLWENNGGEWVLVPNDNPKPAIAYKALPSNMRDEITVSFEIDLGEYENLKPGTQYKIVMNLEKETYEAYFTVTE